MRISFYTNYLITRFSVLGSSGIPKFYNALIDTASEKSAIPQEDCVALKLDYAGDYNPMTAVGNDINFHTYDAAVDVDGDVFNIQIMGIPANTAVLGLDILRNFKITIDWTANPKFVSVEKRL